MAELATLARPYAKAAFQHAHAEGKLDNWLEMLNLAATVARQDRVQALLDAPELSTEAKAQAFSEVCGDALSKDFVNFIHVLADNKRLGLLSHIAEQYYALKSQQEKTVDVEITTAYALSDAEIAKLSKALASKLERAVELTSHVDQSLLGGAVIRAGDTVIDGSVRGRLAKLAETITA
jgi:F-type H+-transporting ATPase subunit delta